MRFEAAQSSNVAIFGMWIGPNSALRLQESFGGVEGEKSGKSKQLARFYICISNTYCPQNIKAYFFRTQKSSNRS